MLVGCSEQLKIKACIKFAAGETGPSGDAGEPVAGLWNFFVASGVNAPVRLMPRESGNRVVVASEACWCRIIGQFTGIVIVSIRPASKLRLIYQSAATAPALVFQSPDVDRT